MRTDLAGYFARRETPSANSSVGKILAFAPDRDLEVVRREAGESLLGMGGSDRLQKALNRWKAKEMRNLSI